MQKLFSTKNESNVLKLWPLFVKLLGKVRHAHYHAIHDFSIINTEEMLVQLNLKLSSLFSCSTKEVPS